MSAEERRRIGGMKKMMLKEFSTVACVLSSVIVLGIVVVLVTSVDYYFNGYDKTWRLSTFQKVMGVSISVIVSVAIIAAVFFGFCVCRRLP